MGSTPTRCANSTLSLYNATEKDLKIMAQSVRQAIVATPGSPTTGPNIPLFVVSIYSRGVLHYPGVVMKATKCGDWLDYPTELFTPIEFMEWKRGRSHCKAFRLRKCAKCFD